MPKKIVLPNWGEVEAYLQQRLNAGTLQAVSVDIFDTLVARIDTPEQIQRHVCRVIAERCQANASATTHVPSLSAQGVFELRQAAERTLRAESYARGLDHECRYSELVPLWVQSLPLLTDVDWVTEITRLELAFEREALYLKPDVRYFLEWLQVHSITVLAISDMYLDGELLEQLLEHLGLSALLPEVIVSADSSLAKHSGRLFEQVRQEYALQPSRWVHIGDNPHSDRKMPCSLGIQGIWLYEVEQLRRIETQQINVQMAAQGGVWTGRYFFAQVQERLQQDADYQALLSSELGEYVRYGAEILAPAFSCFVQGLQERLQAQPVDQVFFIARDGYLFQQMYQCLADTVPHRYLYLSRRVVTAAAMADGLSLAQAQVAFYNPKQSGLASIAKVYGLSEDLLRPFAEAYGFTEFDAPIHDWRDERLLRLLADEQLQTLIREQGQQARNMLEAYLRQEGFFAHQRVAMVDIGWNGTVQRFLQQTFQSRSDFPQLQGYYFAFVPKLYNDLAQTTQAEGIVHDSRRLNDCERIVAECEEIFEQGARALHATTIGYVERSGRYQPVLKDETARDRQAEKKADPLVAALHQGVMCHWQHFQAVQTLTGYNSKQLLPLVYGILERAVVYPTVAEVEAIRRLVHTEDFGHDHVLAFGNMRFKQHCWQPWRLWQQLKTEAWRYAAVCELPLGLANFAMRVAYLHSVKK